MLNERMDVRVEVQGDHVLLVFPKVTDDFTTPWQDAMRLGEVLEMAASDIPNWQRICTFGDVQKELCQVKLNTWKDRYVVLILDHTDRVKLSKEAAILMAREIRKRAQDLELLSRKIRLVYNRRGQIQSVIHHRTDTTQIIPGR